MAHDPVGAPLNLEPGFSGVDAPAEADMYRCVHCGLCLSACPTYTVLGVETESPRGRIAYMKAVHEGRLGISQRVVSHWEACLQCRACETACPSGVPFGRIMESGRAMILQQGAAPRSWRLRAWLLRQTLPYPKRLSVLFGLLRLYQRSGLQRLLRASRLLRILPGGLSEAEEMLPRLPSRSYVMTRGDSPPNASAKKVALLTGCVMPHLYPRTHEATVRVLVRHGIEVVDVPEQRCCWALSIHAGDRVTGRALARRNIDAFLEAGVDAIVVNSAGCGATLMEYGELMEQDNAYAAKARRFSELVTDVNEFVADIGVKAPQAALNVRVTYQDSCHLVHGQKVLNAPRQLLESVPGLELVEMETPDRCCGSAGIYSLSQREMSMSVLDDKMRDIAATKAPVIATANPGCMMQLEAGLRRHGLEGRVVHVIELLDEAYQAEDDSN